jgi:hypothetical protein
MTLAVACRRLPMSAASQPVSRQIVFLTKNMPSFLHFTPEAAGQQHAAFCEF